MQCNNCGYALAPNVPNCPRCGNLTPYNVNVYQTPPPNYGQPIYGQPQQVPYGAPIMVPVVMPPQKRSGCSAAVIVVLILIIVSIGGAYLANGGLVSKNSVNATATAGANRTAIYASATALQATYTTMLTPTPHPAYTESNPPSGSSFSGTAQQIIANAQLASEVNSKYQPTELQSTFRVGQNIYLAYHWQNVGYSGYVATIWYLNGQASNLVHTEPLGTAYAYYDGYFHNVMSQPGQGAVEVYWCEKPDCNKLWLAWVRPFNVVS